MSAKPRLTQPSAGSTKQKFDRWTEPDVTEKVYAVEVYTEEGSMSSIKLLPRLDTLNCAISDSRILFVVVSLPSPAIRGSVSLPMRFVQRIMYQHRYIKSLHADSRCHPVTVSNARINPCNNLILTFIYFPVYETTSTMSWQRNCNLVLLSLWVIRRRILASCKEVLVKDWLLLRCSKRRPKTAIRSIWTMINYAVFNCFHLLQKYRTPLKSSGDIPKKK